MKNLIERHNYRARLFPRRNRNPFLLRALAKKEHRLLHQALARLDFFRHARLDRASQHTSDDADLAVQLVKRPVRLDADVIFGYAGAAVDAGGPAVACPGIDSIQ